MNMDESGENGGFKVSDKRRFSQDGETKATDEANDAQQVREEAQRVEPAPEPTEGDDAGTGQTQEPPPLDFTSLVLSLANTALFQLGLAPGPTDQAEKDIPGARQTIDILAMLQEKTKGNLSEQEEKIMTDALFQLRMAFVEVTK